MLDLGAGYGAVTPELVRRAGGSVIALDQAVTALREGTFAGAGRVGGDARDLPFADGRFDLVFCQLTLLWVHPVEAVIAEVWRVLVPGGVFVALEPDYGGMIEHPPEIATRDLWITALNRAGALPTIGRYLPGILTAQGFEVQVALFETLYPPDPLRFALLRDLLLTETERRELEKIEYQANLKNESWGQIVHLPFFLITAVKS